MRYIAHVPFIPSMGKLNPIRVSSSSNETKEENLLWDLNSSRKHDGLTLWEIDNPYFEDVLENTKWEELGE